MKKGILAILLFGLLIVLISGILEMPALGSVDNPAYTEEVTEYYLENSIEDTNSPNVISALLTDYRFFDTLGETVVLFTGITVVVSVLKRGNAPQHGNEGEN
ncbi:hydrogen gas-evolving membrane-bound hydrogenase subunit E [Proteinivorax hydrogeniformans]|uniref:Hydrogen gas-evolving membrane-bound hydrogenase subunit E n=2 Tax=Proteinivorax TaxID=1491776 RepID=A0AAU7VL81_9FIRM